MTVGPLAKDHTISRAKPRGICWLCGEGIEPREPRLVRYGSTFAHAECGLLLWPHCLPLRAIAEQRFYPAREVEQIQLRRDATDAQATHRAILRARSNATASDSSRFRAIEPLHDRRGRPVVRVYLDVAPSSNTRGTLPIRGNYSAHLLRRTEKRTYTFAWIDQAPEIEDPAIATVGAVLVVDATSQHSVARARAIAELSAMEIATPALWVYGRDLDQRSRSEQLLRSWLTNAGFAGDEAHCVHTTDNHHAAFATLLDALDSMLVEPRWPPLLASTPAAIARSTIDRAIATLDALIEDGDDDGVKKLVQIATKNARATAGEQEQRTAARSLVVLSKPSLRPTILMLCAVALRRDDAGPLLRWVIDECARAPKLTRDIESAAKTLVDLSIEGVVDPLVSLLARCSGAATTRGVASLLERSTNKELSLRVIEALSPHEATWPEKDPRSMAVSGVLAALRARALRRPAQRREPPSKRAPP